jgi:hypothetical protein
MKQSAHIHSGTSSDPDHKYRYVRSRSGVTLPDYIQRGFYNLSVYLQVAALQAEDLWLVFEQFGAVESVNLIKDKFNGQSKGFGFADLKRSIICLPLA